MSEDPIELPALDLRAGLPAELLFLLAEYPRESWSGHENIAGMANMWLQRHEFFRRMGAMLTQGMGEYREGRLAAPAFGQWFAPRIGMFLGELEGHHNIEDHHYFPAFARAEPRLRHGFDILDADHHLIHDALERSAASTDDFLATLRQDADRQRFAADVLVDENARLVALLARHLSDEEDLIIPLILDRGDQMA
ncbi:MAG: hemerythrin domain-containing protein [Rhizobiaceae bacterium]|nr:hemerythrin domain-containing protein [Rhizobiaceae bacterium]